MSTRLFRPWNRFWFGPVSARPLGAFRIVFGLLVLANLALLAFQADLWLSDAGYFQGTEARELAGPLRWSPLQEFQSPTEIRLCLTVTAVVAALFTIGWRTRWMSVLLYLLTLSIHHRNIASNSGADTLMVIILFLLMLSPCGAACSLDARRRSRLRGTMASPLILPWSQRLIQIQISLVYFITALLKATGPTWANGTALHYVLTNSEFCRYSLGLTAYPTLINALTFGTVLLEFTLPILIWFRAARPWILFIGATLHAGILLTVNIPIFGELMVASYLLFLGPEELDRLLRPFRPRHWSARVRELAGRRLRLDASHRNPPSRHEAADRIEASSFPASARFLEGRQAEPKDRGGRRED